ncbi:VOC family protein [Fibrella aquatilis]|uniref:VOC family protein n=1 Tax=Fibrella aquatilis TaxID=2817059 RepID=A0A939JXY0_9BACT|nr:VOC family protein [Fibrella aquatilis]MBO0929768.1 VOC family protein [Fibrella aquatilis]
MKITRLELAVNDLMATQQFYAHRLCLPMVNATYWSATFRVGWTELIFTQTQRPVASYRFALNIPIYSLEQYQLWFDLPYLSLDERGCRIAQFPNWQARAVCFLDPNGNIVEFIERQDAVCTEPGAYFQGVSEVGGPFTTYLSDSQPVCSPKPHICTCGKRADVGALLAQA